MTDNEIVKALECCMGCCCKECPYCDDGADDCIGKLIVETLKLINRQKAEIERLRKYYFTHDYHECHNEAIKEFAGRLKERKYQSTEWSHGGHPFVVEEDDIDDVLEEMTEETKHD